MEYQNLLNFVLSLFLILSIATLVPFVNNIFVAVSVILFASRLAEWLMEITRKYFLYKRVTPENKVILITGCDTGFGNALARRMDKLGYSVLATCLNPDGEGPKKLSEDCSEKLTVLPLDITDEQSIQKVKEYVENNLEENVLWAVINNAGVIQCGQSEWTSVEEFQQACNINAFGALRVTKAFLPFLKRSKGRIVNVTSGAGRHILPGESAYSVSKCTAIALTTSLQMDLFKWGVKCISIEPYLYSTHLVGQGLFTAMKNTWNAAPADIKEEYGNDYFEAFKKRIEWLLFLFASSNISQVIDCLEDAITAVDPLTVYIPASLYLRSAAQLSDALPLGMKQYGLARMCDPWTVKRKEKNY